MEEGSRDSNVVYHLHHPGRYCRLGCAYKGSSKERHGRDWGDVQWVKCLLHKHRELEFASLAPT